MSVSILELSPDLFGRICESVYAYDPRNGVHFQSLWPAGQPSDVRIRASAAVGMPMVVVLAVVSREMRLKVLAWASTVVAERRRLIATGPGMELSQVLLERMRSEATSPSDNVLPLESLQMHETIIRHGRDAVRLLRGPGLDAYVQDLLSDDVVFFDNGQVTSEELANCAFLHVLHDPFDEPRNRWPRIRVSMPRAGSEDTILEWELLESRPYGCMEPQHAPAHPFIDCSGFRDDFDNLEHGKTTLADAVVHLRGRPAARRLTFLPLVRIRANETDCFHEEPAEYDRWRAAEVYPNSDEDVQYYGVTTGRVQ